MSGYQIDEVRELFTADMERLMADLELRSRELRSELDGIRARTEGVDRAQAALTVDFHAIAGTSSLLSVTSSQSVAARLESMMAGLDTAVRSLQTENDRIDRVQRACDVAVDALREIIALELAGDRGSANLRAAEAVQQVQQVSAPPLQVVPPPAAQPDEAAAHDAEREELLEVFREELRGALDDARAQLGELERGTGADRGAALSRLGAVLHMMKGSAASVGESALAIELRAIYEVVEDFLDRGEVPDLAATRRLRLDLDACAAALQPAPAPGVDATWDAPQEAEPEPVDPIELFQVEARALLGQARAALAGVGGDPLGARAELARVLHRLKGSALVVGFPEVGAMAADLERAARDDGGALRVDGAQLDRLHDAIFSGGAVDEPAKPAERARVTREPVPQRVTGELWDSFVEEANELIEAIERNARELETTPDLPALVAALLGTVHTLKGAANTVGLPPVGRELHVVETILETLRAAPSARRRAFVLSRLFDVLERLRKNLRLALRGEVDCGADVLEQDLTRLTKLEDQPVESPSGHSWLSAQDSAWSERGGAATGAGSVGSSRELGSDARSADGGTGGTGQRGAERRFVRVAADRLDALMDMVGELIVARSRVNTGLSTLTELQDSQEARRQRLLDIVDAFTEQAEYANLGGVARRSRRAPGTPTDFGALEFDVYEEVHVLARRLAEASSDVGDTSVEIASGLGNLTQAIDELGAIVSSLQGQINRARMVPLEALFSRLALPARDAAERERKQVDVVFEGAEVVIDKAIADALYAPMLHLVRNAVAHGIEAPTRRRGLGKRERGTVTLSARQEAGEIVIGVRDDGRGLDLAALHRVGVERGLIPASTPPHAAEVLELVFAAGLSTSADTNDVAGRGLGGDVVKRTVQRLGGSARVQSEPERGATFLLRLPLTLAITRAVIIRQGPQLFGVPLPFVERILAHDEAKEVIDVQGSAQRRVRHGDELLSVFRIVPGERKDAVILVCAVGGHRLAIEADAVVAHDEVVVKKLGQVLDGHPLFAGASQRGDGELALILDMHGVAEAHAPLARPSTRPGAEASAAQGRPAEPKPAAELRGATPALAPAAPAAPQEVVVLFVDDSLSVRKVAENTLRKLGVKVVTASDGRDALDRLRDQAISIVFTDLEMPRMHGYELIQEMRYIAAYREIPIVVVSSRSGEKHVQKALESGANEYLTKPFSAEGLGAALHKLVPAYRGGAGGAGER